MPEQKRPQALDLIDGELREHARRQGVPPLVPTGETRQAPPKTGPEARARDV
jgi:hypothetical protein